MSDKPWRGQSVLVVDDSLVAREQLTELYREAGMRVVGTAVNGVEALEFCSKNPPDLVSLDINMPEMDGVECYRKLHATLPEQRVVMISWLAADHRLVEALKDVVPSQLLAGKPIDAEGLHRVLEHAYDIAPKEERLNLEDKDSLGGPGIEMPTYTHKVS